MINILIAVKLLKLPTATTVKMFTLRIKLCLKRKSARQADGYIWKSLDVLLMLGWDDSF